MRIIDWSSDVCSSDLYCDPHFPRPYRPGFVVPQRPQADQRFATNDSSRATSSGTPVASRGGGAARQLGIEVSERRELRGVPADDIGVRRMPAHEILVIGLGGIKGLVGLDPRGDRLQIGRAHV